MLGTKKMLAKSCKIKLEPLFLLQYHRRNKVGRVGVYPSPKEGNKEGKDFPGH